MGRNRKDASGKAGRDSSAQHSAQADLVWPLFLQHILNNASSLDQRQVCCKLLCCSKAMAQQVHSTAAGQLQVSIPGRPPARKSAGKPDPQHADYFKLVSRWLGRNAKLLKSLAVQEGATSLAPADEQVLSTAVAAAAGSNSTACGPVTRSTAVVIRAATAAAAAACADAAQHGQQQQEEGLPMQELSVAWRWYALRSSLLCALSVACPHLLHLKVSTSDAAINPDAVRALGRLTSLLDLSWAQNQGYVSIIAPAVEKLTRLTRLYVSGCLPGQQFAPQLPTTLVQLTLPDSGWWTSIPLEISHLTHLKQLAYGGHLLPTHQLPESLTQLKVRTVHSHEPLLPLQYLQMLTFEWDQELLGPCHLSQVTQLQQLELSTGFGMHVYDQEWGDVLSWVTIPIDLQGLSNVGPARLGESACEASATFTHLQNLGLHGTKLSVPPARLGAALCGLSQLTKLQLCLSWYEAASGDAADLAAATELRPLYQGIAALPALQQLHAVDSPLTAGAVSALASATQLTALWLKRCDLTREHISVLRTGLTQLGSSHCLEGRSKHIICYGDAAVYDPTLWD